MLRGAEDASSTKSTRQTAARLALRSHHRVVRRRRVRGMVKEPVRCRMRVGMWGVVSMRVRGGVGRAVLAGVRPEMGPQAGVSRMRVGVGVWVRVSVGVGVMGRRVNHIGMVAHVSAG